MRGRPSSRALAVVACVACVALFGCTVDGTFLDEDLFLCATSTDCGDGWGCVRASPYAADFCASACEETCDGKCVRQGDEEACLRGCRILDDGTTSACADGYSCIRISAQSDDGVCYPVTGCNRDVDCEGGEACLSALAEAFGVGGGGLRTDNLYCVPAPDDPTACPPRSVHTDTIFGDSTGFEMCVPLCDASDTRCPPAFGCLRQLALSGETPCLPGIYGIPCDDDTNCMLGRCIDTGPAGRFCTTSCGDAERIGLGCENISAVISMIGLRWRLECDPSGNGGDDGGLCVPRYEIGFPCTEPESQVFACADGLTCTAFGAGDVRFCTKACETDAECNEVGRSRRNFCSTIVNRCVPQLGPGEMCIRNENCVSNRCIDGTCA